MTGNLKIEPTRRSLECMMTDLKSLLASTSKSTEGDDETLATTPEDILGDENYFTFMGQSAEGDEPNPKHYSSEKLHKFFNLGKEKGRVEGTGVQLQSERSLSDRSDKIRRFVMSKITGL